MTKRRLAQAGPILDDSRGAIDHTSTEAGADDDVRTGLDPCCWAGGVWFVVGNGGSWNSSTSRSARSSCRLVSGSRGNRLGTVPSAEVKSPTVCRRHGVMLGLTTPVTRSRSRVTEVWSKVSWETNPPTVHGETMMQGTRKPRPIGPGADFVTDVGMYSPAVPAGAVGGATWSKYPSFSS